MSGRADSRMHYDRIAVALHWTIAALLLLVASLALFRETFASHAAAMITAHKPVGLAVLGLSLARLAWRLHRPPPPLPPSMPRWERSAAAAVHWLLILLLVAVPLAGWVFVSLAPETRPVDWRGGDSVPELPLGGPDDPRAFFWHEVHELMGFAAIGLALVHTLAALRHLLRRDGTFGRMLP